VDFHELAAFAALARHLHFAKAAASVNTSASALSRLLTRLEDEAGARLFDRDTRRVRLTEAGRVFLEFAEDSLRRRDQLTQGLDSLDGRLRGTLRVYASVTACYTILPPFVEALAAEHPELRLSVETGDPADAEAVLREGRTDLALAAMPDGGFPGMDCFKVRTTPLVFVSARLPRDVARSDAPEPDWSTVPLILPRRGLARERFDRWARGRDLRVHVVAETAGNEAILALARLGQGLGLVPRIVLDNSPFAEGLAVLAPGPELGDYDIGFVLPPAKPGTDRGLRAAVTDVLHHVYGRP
jgi:LysR family transcriptional regulator, positive regulator for ilvC